MLACVGSRCWIRMKAMPVPAGSTSSSLRKASRPPAEAPSPTTGKLSAASSEPRLCDERRLSPRASRSGLSRTLSSHSNARSFGIAQRCSSGADMRYIQTLQRADVSLPPVLIVSPSRGVVGNVHYRTGAGSLFMRMFWEDEKRCAPGPTDSIHKMPPRGPADQVWRLAVGRAQSNRHVPSSGQHW